MMCVMDVCVMVCVLWRNQDLKSAKAIANKILIIGGLADCRRRGERVWWRHEVKTEGHRPKYELSQHTVFKYIKLHLCEHYANWTSKLKNYLGELWAGLVALSLTTASYTWLTRVLPSSAITRSNSGSQESRVMLRTLLMWTPRLLVSPNNAKRD